jgi:2EXR family
VQMFKPQEAIQDQPAKEVQSTVGFLSVDYKLRKYIWTLALQQPRLIELTKSSTYSVQSHAAVPALLHTCRESRAIAKKHYALAFATHETSPKVYFDFQQDWIYTRCSGCLGTGCTHKLMLTEDHKKLKRLIFEGPMTYNPFPKIVRFYPAVEKLIIISGKSSTRRGEINKDNIYFVRKVLEWDCNRDLLALAEKAWMDLEPSGGKPMALSRIWQATLPDVVDGVKRSSDPKKGLWTCCS